jgi:hypothetical protein
MSAKLLCTSGRRHRVWGRGLNLIGPTYKIVSLAIVIQVSLYEGQ